MVIAFVLEAVAGITFLSGGLDDTRTDKLGAVACGLSVAGFAVAGGLCFLGAAVLGAAQAGKRGE